jgi:enoyl-[acyl-carrier protein] reductase II
MQSRIPDLFGVRIPLIQAGMVWNSGWRLAAAVSNAGGLGVIGSGSMYPEILQYHLQQCKAHCSFPFGVNIPLLYPDIESHIEAVIAHRVPVVITSAGNPATYTKRLKDAGIRVVHVVASAKFAEKAQKAGCDAVVAEGFEAGGHNGREETTSFVLIPLVKAAVDIPVIAAGGIATGKQMLAAMILGAEAVQIGTRFVCTYEASSHDSFKEAVIQAGEGATQLSMKKTVPVRLLKNAFYHKIQAAEDAGADASSLKEILGKGRAKKGMFEGDLEEGELEIGQVAALVQRIQPAAEVVAEIWREYNELLESIKKGA